MSKEAEEYLKNKWFTNSKGIVDFDYDEYGDNEMGNKDTAKLMQSYANHVLKKELEEMTDEVIDKKYPIGLTMTTNAHYRSRHKRIGAKWLRDQILSKTNGL